MLAHSCVFVGIAVVVSYAASVPDAGDELAKQMEKLKDKMFKAKCNTNEYTKPMDKCIWYKGNWGARLENRVQDMQATGCKVPPTSVMNQLMKRFGNFTWWSESPIVKKIPDTPCGFCGRKVKCCTKGANFLEQSYFSEPCETTGTPCNVEQLTAADFTYMKEKYNDWTNTFTDNDVCNYNMFMTWAANRFQTTKAYGIVKPLMCQLFGTLKPQINCASNNGKCLCCCTGYSPVNGVCTPSFPATTATSTTTQHVDNTCDNL